VTTLPRIIIERCHYLSECTEERGEITRPFASEAMRCAHSLAMDWMQEAGMDVRRDNVGNLRGRYEGDGGATLLLGSHLDSVRDAGKYDGPLGVITAIASVQRLHDEARRLPFAIEVLAFADEEGLRYGSTYLGSRAVAGRFDPRDLERADSAGITMSDAIRNFGGDPDRVDDDRWRGGDLLGYLEVHIEQGPVLEARGLPVGVVSAIAGQSRFEIEFTGMSGHAGTVPMGRRRDALAGAAELVLAVEAAASTEAGMVATVGKLDVGPGVTNVIPGRTTLSLDARHPDDATRKEFVEAILARTRDIARRRKLTIEVRPVSENAAIHCSPPMRKLLAEAVRGVGVRPIELASGAGHDAVVMSSLTEVGMLFVRCKGGVSHNPAESVTTEDVSVALDVTSRFLDLLAKQ
jgi:allantoate deiminase